jgi:hypothetical protein
VFGNVISIIIHNYLKFIDEWLWKCSEDANLGTWFQNLSFKYNTAICLPNFFNSLFPNLPFVRNGSFPSPASNPYLFSEHSSHFSVFNSLCYSQVGEFYIFQVPAKDCASIRVLITSVLYSIQYHFWLAENSPQTYSFQFPDPVCYLCRHD